MLHPWIGGFDNDDLNDEFDQKVEWLNLTQMNNDSDEENDSHSQVRERGLTAPDEEDDDNLTGVYLNSREDMQSERQQNINQGEEDGVTLSQNHKLQQSATSSQLTFMNASAALRRRNEEHESGVRGTQFEDSPVRDNNENKPRKTLEQHFSL